MRTIMGSSPDSPPQSISGVAGLVDDLGGSIPHI